MQYLNLEGKKVLENEDMPRSKTVGLHTYYHTSVEMRTDEGQQADNCVPYCVYYLHTIHATLLEVYYQTRRYTQMV